MPIMTAAYIGFGTGVHAWQPARTGVIWSESRRLVTIRTTHAVFCTQCKLLCSQSTCDATQSCSSQVVRRSLIERAMVFARRLRKRGVVTRRSDPTWTLHDGEVVKWHFISDLGQGCRSTRCSLRSPSSVFHQLVMREQTVSLLVDSCHVALLVAECSTIRVSCLMIFAQRVNAESNQEGSFKGRDVYSSQRQPVSFVVLMQCNGFGLLMSDNRHRQALPWEVRVTLKPSVGIFYRRINRLYNA